MVETIIHVVIGGSAFFFCLITAILGATMAGRFGKKKINKKIFKSHKFLSIFAGFLMITAFLVMIEEGEIEFEGELEFENLHGLFGMLIFIFALLQVVPSLVIKKRKKIKMLHRYIGYILLILVTVQFFSGLSRIL